ncbi:MAG TPA: FtsX-like permease family protein [Acidimicrobiales bacterium]|nr:FtsX-like permease family protein [Acidimicrobiales bacterium]
MKRPDHVASALSRKSWTDLGRRPVRAVLTVLTLALAVASFGIVAIPSLVNRAMAAEVARAHLYDVSIPIQYASLSRAQLAALDKLPNVSALSARSVFTTRALIGTKRVAAEVWGVANFADQPVDQVISTSRPGTGAVLVDVRDAMSGITHAVAGDTLRVLGADGTYRLLPVSGSARAMAFDQDTLSGDLVLYANQATVQNLGGFRGYNLLELRLLDTRTAAAQATVTAVRSFLAHQPTPTAFSNVPTLRSPGDFPLKAVFGARAKILDILIVLAVISAALLLANTIRTLVAEQSREIGVMRCIGASGRAVRNSYLRTAAILGILGSIVGSALGVGLAFLMLKVFARMVFGISPGFAVDWPIVGIGAVAGLAGTMLTAWPTLRRVLHTPVHDALASEGTVAAFGGSTLDRAVLRSGALPPPVRIGVRNVVRQKGRSVTTIVQIALAVATLLGLLSLTLAVSETTDQSWNVLAYDITMSAQQGGNWFSPAVVNQIRTQPGVAGVEAADWSQLAYKGQTLYGLGVPAHTFIREPLAAGRWVNARDEASGANVAIVGSAVARRWDLHPGSRLTLASAGGPVTFAVVGVGGSQANNGYNLYTTLTALQRATGRPGVANSLFVRTADKRHSSIDALAARLENVLARSGHPSRSQVMYAGRATDKATADSMLVVVEGIGLLIVAIGMLGLVNALTMSIIERTREIGVLRCLGARARDLRRIFRTETITLALIGFAVAIPLGWGIAKALQWLVLHVAGGQLPAPYTLRNLAVAFVGTVVLAVLVVIAPLRRATRLRPGDAIRYG